MSGEIDSWVITAGGVSYLIEIDPDYSASPRDFDCYSADDIEAFDGGAWRFVGVTVTPQLPGADGEMLSDSLWSVEWGEMPETDISRDYIAWTHPVPDMISVVRANLTNLRDALNKLLECGDKNCRDQGCPEHPAHSGADHTYEQHHSPSDHVGEANGGLPEPCRCTAYAN